MANLITERADERQEGILNNEKVAGATKLFKGSIASHRAGLLVKGADTAGDSFAGVIYETVDNTNGAAGALEAKIWKEGIFEFNASGATQSWVGQDVFAVDDNTVALAATTTNDVRVGKVVGFVSSTKVRVKI